MINLDLAWALAVYIGGVICFCLVLWVLPRRTRHREPLLEERFIWFCSVCTYTYVNTTEEAISVCPRCSSYNKK